MDEEMSTLYQNQTWELSSLPWWKANSGLWVGVHCKYHPNGLVECLKAQLVAKGHTQTYGVDNMETFSPLTRLNSVRILISVAVNC